jgi:hypothetical protein
MGEIRRANSLVGGRHALMERRDTGKVVNFRCAGGFDVSWPDKSDA